MKINLTKETIGIICDTLKNRQHALKSQLEYGIPCGKVNPNKKEDIEKKLFSIKKALKELEI